MSKGQIQYLQGAKMVPIMKSFMISACIRGFHVYCAIWKPQMGENLSCFQEPRNMYDMYAVGIPSYFLLGEDVYQEEKTYWPHTVVHIKICLVFH